MALNRLRTSCPSALSVELLEEDDEEASEVELVCAEAGTAYVSRVVSALCAPSMLLSESAVETLDRNSPSGLFALVFAGCSFSTSARSFSAEDVSPDLMADMRLESAVSNEFCLLEDEAPEVELADDVESSENNELIEIPDNDISSDPFVEVCQEPP
jgi:hypothetical protein